MVTNRDVVPYNPHILALFQTHVNVEVCGTLYAVKYLHKYIHKGGDRLETTFVDKQDEVLMYEAGRYLSSSEAVWRLFAFEVHAASPQVVRLNIHLPGEHRVTFDEFDGLFEVRAAPARSMLLAWFEYNEWNAEARDVLYVDFPANHRWMTQHSKWQLRVVHALTPAIGRIYWVSPRGGEKYYLRVLLHHVPGAQSFEHLRTVEGTLLPTFKDACLARGLLRDDEEWARCLDEAAGTQSASSLRALFAIILDFNAPRAPGLLWKRFENDLCEDFTFQGQPLRIARSNALREVERYLSLQGKSLSDFEDMPKIEEPSRTRLHLLHAELMYDAHTQRAIVQRGLALLTEEQTSVYQTIMDAISFPTDAPKCFFLQAAGGCGKTFLQNLMLATVRSTGNVAIATAMTGIAALLLVGGTTSHSAFGLPLVFDDDETAVSNLSMHSQRAEVLRRSHLILIDSATMGHKTLYHVVDVLLREIMRSVDEQLHSVPFGGKLIVFSGDWRQMPPVIPNAGRAATVNACLKRSPLWQIVRQVTLTQNMRLLVLTGCDREREALFAKWLLDIGNGHYATVQFPPGMYSSMETPEQLIDQVFGDDVDLANEGTCLLTPLNRDVDSLNKAILQRCKRPAHFYMSADYLGTDSLDNEYLYPPEVLNALNYPGTGCFWN